MARTIFVKVRATDKERDEWNRVADARGTTVSKMLRSHMERVIKSQERKAANERGAAE